MTFNNKNCYLIFGGDYNEDCMYGTLCMGNKNTFDNDYGNHNQLCYEIRDSINCYACQFASDSKNCNNCYFISDCSGCSECILCTNLNQKSYCIENKQFSREEYMHKKQELITGSYQKQQELIARFLELCAKRIVKYSHMINCENCTGDYMKNSKNCQNSFDITGSQDLKNVLFSSVAKDCEECSLLGDNSELCFNLISTFGAYNSKYSFFTIDSSNIEYSEFSIGSHDLFGCISLRNESNCILNKKYKEDEYKILKEKIIAHMHKTGEYGQFFPSQLSCFGYNETSAHDYFPFAKEEALAQGYKWKDEEDKTRHPQSIQLPDNIADTDQAIVNEILTCENCGKNFRILPQEFEIYKKSRIPVPRICPDCRHEKRMSMRNPRYLWDRTCAKCGMSIQTTYATDRPETVYCEKCYLETVY